MSIAGSTCWGPSNARGLTPRIHLHIVNKTLEGWICRIKSRPNDESGESIGRPPVFRLCAEPETVILHLGHAFFSALLNSDFGAPSKPGGPLCCCASRDIDVTRCSRKFEGAGHL